MAGRHAMRELTLVRAFRRTAATAVFCAARIAALAAID
jgi:hypothetical protein